MLINDGGIFYDEETAEFLKNCKPEDIVFTNERKNIKRKSEKKTEKLICDGGIYYDEETAEILNSDDLSSHIRIKPVYLPYTQWRIKSVFAEAGYRLQPVYLGYKGLRYRPCQRYWIIDVETNEKFGTSDNGYSFEDLRYFLASCDIPLQGDKPKKTYRKDGRRQGCVEFLKIVESIGNSVDDK